MKTMNESREYKVSMPTSWSGPGRIRIQAPGMSLVLSNNPLDERGRSRIVTLSEEQVSMLRQNGLSVRAFGKKPRTEQE